MSKAERLDFASTAAPARVLSTWLGLGLWTGCLLGLGRAAVLLVMDTRAAGIEWVRAQQRLDAALPREMVIAVSAGLLAIWLIARFARRGRPQALLGHALAAALFLSVLSGWPLADPSRFPGLQTTRGRQAVLALAVVSVLGVSLASLLSSNAGRRRFPSLWRWLASGVGIGLAGALVVGAVLTVRLGFANSGERMTLRQIVAELLHDAARWEVVEESSSVPVRVDVLCPSDDWRIEGGDRPSLVMVPPAEVRLAIRPEDGPVRLRAEAGIDRTVWFGLADEEAEFRMRFEVERNGEHVFDQVLALRRDTYGKGSPWTPVGGEEGVALAPGDVVTLRTSIPDGAENRLVDARPWLGGFGTLRLERTRELERTRATPQRPNIVFVVMDTLRRDRTSLYGYARETTPALDALGARGLVFDEAYATSSYTWPSTASLLTGLQPEQHGVLTGSSCYLATDLVTIAERLQEAGYTTAAFSGNPLIVPAKNFDQGFEFFDYGRASFRKAAQFMPAALEWLEHNADHRLFLYLQLTEPHSPLKPDAEGRSKLADDVPVDFTSNAIADLGLELREGRGHTPEGEVDTERLVSKEEQRWISELYDASVWTGDRWLGVLLEKLTALGLDDRTVIVFTSDHGEEFFDHGHAGHDQSVYGELVRVPLVLVGPGIPVGRRVTTPVSNRHLFPTLSRLAGVDPPAGAVDLLAADALVPSPVLFSTLHGWWNGWHRTPIFGLRQGERVLHFSPEAGDWKSTTPTEGGQWRLFDLSIDPLERTDISAAEPETAEEMRRYIERRVEELRALRSAPAVPAGDATLQMLEDIGYLGKDE